MDEINDLLSFDWMGSKKGRYTLDKWSLDDNVRPLKSSKATAQALLTGTRQLNPTKQYKLVAADLDNKDNWEDVLETYKALNLPQSLTVSTPSGGFHVFFWVPKNTAAQNINDDRHCDNFELKGDGNNITAPGSVFECGATYRVVRDMPIAKLLPKQAYRLCKQKIIPPMPYVAKGDMPDTYDVEAAAKHLDERARRNPRGWQVRCPEHMDRRSSAVLFDSGWLYCSGCSHKELIVKREKL